MPAQHVKIEHKNRKLPDAGMHVVARRSQNAPKVARQAASRAIVRRAKTWNAGQLRPLDGGKRIRASLVPAGTGR